MTTAPGKPREALLECRDLVKHFPISGSKDKVQAVNAISFTIGRGETLGLVGESGSGKTTVGKMLLGLHQPTAGDVLYRGERISGLTNKEFLPFRPRIQAVFQDPYDSLDPRRPAREAIVEPLERMKLLEDPGARRERVRELADLVRLRQALLDRYPHELSGGQQQKVGVARALASAPEFIVLDEPTSALSPSDRAELIAILTDLQKRLGVTYLFITHDLKVVETIADQIAVMYLGRIVELGRVDDVITHRVHPYTQALLGSVLPTNPGGRGSIRVLEGEIPSPIDLPHGCAFHSRCALAGPECLADVPPLIPVSAAGRRVPTDADGQLVACVKAPEAALAARHRNGSRPG